MKREARKCVKELSLDEEKEGCHCGSNTKVTHGNIARPDQLDDLKGCDASEVYCTNSEDELKVLYQLALLAVSRHIS